MLPERAGEEKPREGLANRLGNDTAEDSAARNRAEDKMPTSYIFRQKENLAAFIRMP